MTDKQPPLLPVTLKMEMPQQVIVIFALDSFCSFHSFQPPAEDSLQPVQTPGYAVSSL